MYEFIKKSSLFHFLEPMLVKVPALISLIVYRICQSGPMYNAHEWRQGNAIFFLEKNISLSSQDISRYLAYLGKEEVQRKFFKSYLHKDNLGLISSRSSVSWTSSGLLSLRALAPAKQKRVALPPLHFH